MDSAMQACNERERGRQGGVAMSDATAEFFQQLAARGHEPLLGKVKGTIRFDLVNGTRTDRWLVTFDQGDVSVSRKNVAADCVVRVDRALFDAMVSGDANGMAAYLRGRLTFDGDPEFLVLFQRVLPGPATQLPSRPAGRDQR
jgi:putative sterol carrier protein